MRQRTSLLMQRESWAPNRAKQRREASSSRRIPSPSNTTFLRPQISPFKEDFPPYPRKTNQIKDPFIRTSINGALSWRSRAFGQRLTHERPYQRRDCCGRHCHHWLLLQGYSFSCNLGDSLPDYPQLIHCRPLSRMKALML